MMEGPGAESEEKREPVSDIDTAVADSLKVLDLKWPIREADIRADVSQGLHRAAMSNLRQFPSDPCGAICPDLPKVV